MSFKTATARLRLALIPLLANARAIGTVQTLFEQIFWSLVQMQQPRGALNAGN
jgi:hypothetical protein